MNTNYDTVWVSHSSITDYLKCPRAYFLNNVYRDPRSGHKISLMQPPLALGQAVHATLEGLSILPVSERFKEPLVNKFVQEWEKVSGKLGGFRSEAEEKEYKERGGKMIQQVMDNPGPIALKAIKIKQELPSFLLSEEDNIMLCGKIDWLEYLPSDNSVHIIDFKTGRKDENPASLQLPIYYLLVSRCQTRSVGRMSYWYLDRHPEPQEVGLPDARESQSVILELARKIKLARKLEAYKCPRGGCANCAPLEQIKNGQAEFVGVGNYNQDIYILNFN